MSPALSSAIYSGGLNLQELLEEITKLENLLSIYENEAYNLQNGIHSVEEAAEQP